MELRELNPGDVITAEWLNGVLALAQGRGEATRGGAAGVSGAERPGVTARVLAAIKPDEWVQCRITAVLAPGGGLVPEWPSNVRYNIIGVGRPGIVLTNVAPVFGRPVKGDEAKIWPAAVGLTCYIVRSPAADNSGTVQADLVLLDGSEVVWRRICSGPGAVRAGVDAVRVRPLEPKPIPLPEELLGPLAIARAGIVTADSGKTTGGGGEVAGAGGGGGDAGGLSGPGDGGSIG